MSPPNTEAQAPKKWLGRPNRRLKARKEIRGALADIARAIECGEINHEIARTLAYVLKLLDESMKDRDLEKMAKRLQKFADVGIQHADN